MSSVWADIFFGSGIHSIPLPSRPELIPSRPELIPSGRNSVPPGRNRGIGIPSRPESSFPPGRNHDSGRAGKFRPGRNHHSGWAGTVPAGRMFFNSSGRPELRSASGRAGIFPAGRNSGFRVPAGPEPPPDPKTYHWGTPDCISSDPHLSPTARKGCFWSVWPRWAQWSHFRPKGSWGGRMKRERGSRHEG